MTAQLIRIRTVGLMPNVRWLGPSPWPPLPSAPDESFICCDDQPAARVTAVLVHLPRHPGDPTATVVVQSRDQQWGEHLIAEHDFRLG